MANYTKMTVGKENRTELHEKLALTGAEISLNTLPAGANVPFVHSHKANEEIYGVLSGKGKVVIDGEEIPLLPGTAFMVPAHTDHVIRRDPSCDCCKVLWFHAAVE